MARWLYDTETGEYFQEDELDPSSYEVSIPKKPTAPVGSATSDPLLLASGVVGKSLAGIADAAGGFTQSFGEGLSGITGGAFGQGFIDSGRNVQQLAQNTQDLADRRLNLQEGSFAKDAVDFTSGVAPILGLAATGVGAIPVALTAGAQVVGNKYGDLRDSGVAPGPAFVNSFGSGAVATGANAIPLSFLGKSTGSWLSRWLKESAKVGAANAVINPAQTVSDAILDYQVSNIPTSPDELGARVSSSIKQAVASAPLF